MIDCPNLVDFQNKSFAETKLLSFNKVCFTIPILPSKTIIFLHVPKTAGTNLSFISDALSKTDPNFRITRFAVPRVDGRSPCYITEGWQGGLESANKKLDSEPYFCDEMNFISGHFPFGLHKKLHQSAQYITLIRHPVERELSSANFDFQRGYIQEDHFQEYLLSGLDNSQVRLISGQMSGECTDETLNLAKNNIEKHFMLAGVTEYTNQFIEVLASIQGWKSIAIAKPQVTGMKVVYKPSEELIDRLSNKHRYDIELHAWVKQRWLEWCEHIVHDVVKPNLEEEILCINANYATTKTPVKMIFRDIETYNLNQTSELVEISQNHTKVKLLESPIAAPITYGLNKTDLLIAPVDSNIVSEQAIQRPNNKIVL